MVKKEAILDSENINYTRGSLREVGRRMDFIIPNKENPEIIIECSETRNCIKWQNKAELLSEISQEFNCEVMFVSNKISEFGKKVLKTRGVSGVNIKEL